jgi:hypothetical protein
MFWNSDNVKDWIASSLVTVTVLVEQGASADFQQGYVAALATLGAMHGIKVQVPPMPPPQRMIDQR